jgi:predicted TIM-barrel fold metal-dependent hydrolase
MHDLPGRRRFLKQTLALTASALSPQGASARERADVFPIIDTHQHLWDLKRFQLPWLKDNPTLRKNFLMEDYLEATAHLTSPGKTPAKIVKTVYMEVDVDPSQQAEEAAYVLDICKRGASPMVAAVISGRPADDGFERYISAYKGSKFIKGVRQVLHRPELPPDYCLKKNFLRGIRLLGNLGMSFDIVMRPDDLENAAKLVAACPDTRFILDHCGNGDVQARDRSRWQKGMAAVARHEHVVCKVSGIVASAAPGKWTADDLAPIVRHTVEVFGKDRVMFGGDWPVCTLAATYEQWVSALGTIVRDWKDEDQRKLFHDNAQRVYEIGG